MLTIDPVKVKQAADKCPAAAETLKTLFPEVFEKKVVIKARTTENFGERVIAIDTEQRNFLIAFEDDRFRLSPLYNWEIVSGNEKFYESGASETLLIPTPKY